MSDYVYGGQDNKQFYTNPGDYKFEVIGFETKVSGGNATRGARITNLKLKIEPSGVTCFASLIFHQSCDWKTDTFCKCTGIECKVGEMPAELKAGDERLLVGLCGWGTFGIREHNGKKYNELLTWITNKEKLTRKPPPTAEEVAKAGVGAPPRRGAVTAPVEPPQDDDVPF